MFSKPRVHLNCTFEQIGLFTLSSQRVSDMPISTSPTSPVLSLLLCRSDRLIDLCAKRN
jgi:hypothetical protein